MTKESLDFYLNCVIIIISEGYKNQYYNKKELNKWRIQKILKE